MFAPRFFKESSFQYALFGALVWHLFWFFVITVDITPRSAPDIRPTRIYFLGPVLTDESFNLILETKPELSQTAYQAPEETLKDLEPDFERMGRQSPGDLVSVPMGGRTGRLDLRGALTDDKERPRRVFYEKFPIEIIKSPFPITGELASRGLFYVPDKKLLPWDKLPPGERALAREAEFEIRVDPDGRIAGIENTLSSGYPDLDDFWRDYLREWQFMPLEGFGETQSGRVRLKADAPGEAAP